MEVVPGLRTMAAGPVPVPAGVNLDLLAASDPSEKKIISLLHADLPMSSWARYPRSRNRVSSRAPICPRNR